MFLRFALRNVKYATAAGLLAMATVAATCSAPKDIVLVPLTPAPVADSAGASQLQVSSYSAPSDGGGLVSLPPGESRCPVAGVGDATATPVVSLAGDEAETAPSACDQTAALR